MEKLLTQASHIIELIKESDEFIQVKKYENIMMNDETTLKKRIAVDKCEQKYDECLRFFGDNSKESKAAQQNLYEAKKILDNDINVQNYINAYKKLRIMIEDINKIIFNGLDLSKKVGEY